MISEHHDADVIDENGFACGILMQRVLEARGDDHCRRSGRLRFIETFPLGETLAELEADKDKKAVNEGCLDIIRFDIAVSFAACILVLRQVFVGNFVQAAVVVGIVDNRQIGPMWRARFN